MWNAAYYDVGPHQVQSHNAQWLQGMVDNISASRFRSTGKYFGKPGTSPQPIVLVCPRKVPGLTALLCRHPGKISIFLETKKQREK